jgi:ParB family chromosome partitioning protein
VNPAESASLKAALEAAQVEMVPLSALVKSLLNVRTIPYTDCQSRGVLSAAC